LSGRGLLALFLSSSAPFLRSFFTMTDKSLA